MARAAGLDLIQTHLFWVADVTPEFTTRLSDVPYWALNPVMGFATCTGPGLQTVTETINPGTSMHSVTVVKRATASPITLTRGMGIMDSDLYRWMVRTIAGVGRPRRNLMLLHFLSRGFDPKRGAASVGLGFAAAAGAGGFAAAGAGVAGSPAKAVAGGASAVSLGLMAAAAIGSELGDTGLVRIPVKAWLLGGCIPTSFKGSSDLDAKAADVSIQELELTPSWVDEVSLTA